MARQEIKLGDLWDLVFEKLNANFEELFGSLGDTVTSAELSAELTARLSAYMTTDAFTAAIADYVTSDQLTSQLANCVTDGELAAAISDFVTTNALNTSLADYVTSTALATMLADYVTTAAQTAALANKVDKEAGKGLSTNDYTTTEKQKLAELTAPTKYEFTAGSWGTASADGVYSLNITTNQHVVGVFRANGSAYENAAVAISVSGGTVTLKTEETFAGYAVLV